MGMCGIKKNRQGEYEFSFDELYNSIKSSLDGKLDPYQKKVATSLKNFGKNIPPTNYNPLKDVKFQYLDPANVKKMLEDKGFKKPKIKTSMMDKIIRNNPFPKEIKRPEFDPKVPNINPWHLNYFKNDDDKQKYIDGQRQRQQQGGGYGGGGMGGMGAVVGGAGMIGGAAMMGGGGHNRGGSQNQVHHNGQYQQTQRQQQAYQFPEQENKGFNDDIQFDQQPDQELQAALDECKRTGRSYSDPDFPGDSRAISCVDSQIQGQQREAEFLRVSDEMQGAEVFVGIHPNDIKQGGLGDCYFLSALSALALYPQIIQRLFNVKEFNRQGVYQVMLFIDGYWQAYTIDDIVPFIYGQPGFSKSVDNELWVMILEKAYAKAYGGYYNISAGLSDEALQNLTGAPNERHRHDPQNVKKTWEYIKQNLERKYFLCAGSHGQGEMENECGIISGHAYSILQCYDTGKHQIVKLRNPWGKSEWKGL